MPNPQSLSEARRAPRTLCRRKREEQRALGHSSSVFSLQMLMVVFGAGASYDSLGEYPPFDFTTFQQLGVPHIRNEPVRPLLAAQLFQYERFSELFATNAECVRPVSPA